MRCRPLVALALGFAACASMSPSTSTPPEGDPRAEIAQLKARIGYLRGSVHLPSTPPTGVSTGTPGWERCRQVTAAADEICRAAVRICALAEILAEDDARQSCTQAQEDCRRARTSADECK
jgi:hypothetical protein